MPRSGWTPDHVVPCHEHLPEVNAVLGDPAALVAFPDAYLEVVVLRVVEEQDAPLGHADVPRRWAAQYWKPSSVGSAGFGVVTHLFLSRSTDAITGSSCHTGGNDERVDGSISGGGAAGSPPLGPARTTLVKWRDLRMGYLWLFSQLGHV